MSVAVSLFTLCTLVSSLQCGNCLEIPKWADIFSALQPYKDENNQMLEEVDEADNGEPRLGFVQVIKIPQLFFFATVSLIFDQKTFRPTYLCCKLFLQAVLFLILK